MDVIHNMNPTGRGYRIPMPSGIYVYPEDPRPEDFNINDVAHKLAMQCRYGGGTTSFYSVAEHCVLLSVWIEKHYGKRMALAALLHDRAEAWLQDFIRPVKVKAQPWYGQMEDRIECVSAPVFGVPYPNPPEVMEADFRICIDEKRQLYAAEFQAENTLEETAEPLGIKCEAWSPYVARSRFMARYRELTRDVFR